MNFDDRSKQLRIEETDIIEDEQYRCVKCGSVSYSSIYMEKCTSKAPIPYSIHVDSIGPASIFYCSCVCGASWLESATPTHHRPRIRAVTMKSFTKPVPVWIRKGWTMEQRCDSTLYMIKRTDEGRLVLQEPCTKEDFEHLKRVLVRGTKA